MTKEIVASVLELLTLLSTIFIFLLLVLFILKFVFKTKTKLYDKTVHFLQDHYLFLGFIISLVATAGSLFYSNIMGYVPCKLCWFQRIFMYPQPILFLIAMNIKNNDFKSIIPNSLILSVIGFFIAGYHYLLQINVLTSSGCDVVGYSTNCSEFFSLSYGFITIPMMSFIAFTLLIILSYGKIRDIQVRRK